MARTYCASPAGMPAGNGDTDGNGVIDILDAGDLASDYVKIF